MVYIAAGQAPSFHEFLKDSARSFVPYNTRLPAANNHAGVSKLGVTFRLNKRFVSSDLTNESDFGAGAIYLEH